MRAAEAGAPCRFQLLIYPVTNLVEPSESRRLFSRGLFLTEEFMQIVDWAYIPPGHDRGDPLVSVALTEKLPPGLAPTYVVTAGFDPLRDEGEAYARRLADEGLSVQLKRYPGFVHGFVNMVGVSNPRAALAEIAVKLKIGLAD